MPDTPPADRGQAIAAVEGAIARAELQVTLLRLVAAVRAAAGRDGARLEELAGATERRAAELRADLGRLLVGREAGA